MAGNDILAAYLAARQLGGKQSDPLAERRRYGDALMQTGASMEPVRSWGEGLARALQGGVGGYFAGAAEREGKEENAGNMAALAEYIKTGNAESLKGMKGELGNMVSAQLAGQKMTSEQNAAGANALGAAYGLPTLGTAASVQQAGGGAVAPTPLGPLPAGSLPAGDFANNTGNIRASNVNWDGKGAPQNGFETFSTPQAGVNAQFKNFQAYAQANPQMTVAQALAKWAPPNENDTNGYIAKISEESGVNPGQPLAEVLKDPMVASRLLDAQTRLEKGGMPQGVTADTFIAASGGGPAPGMPGQIAQPQQQVAQGDSLPGNGTGTPNATPSAVSGPPEPPRPKASPELIEKYQRLMLGPNGITRQQAAAGIDKELADEWQMKKQLALETWKDQQQSKRQNEKAAIDLGQKAPMEMIAKRVDNYETKIRPAAVAAVNDINAAHAVRQMLDAGAFTGTGAEAKTMLAKIGEQFGIPSEQATNTQVLGSVLAKRVLAAAGGSLGAGFSNADRSLVEQASGANINMDEAAMRRLADISERQARQTIAQHDQESARVQKLPGIGQLGADQFTIPTAPGYAEWSKANPLAPIQGAPQSPAAPAAGGGVAEGATATNPQTGQKIIFRGGQWVPVQ